MLTRFNGQTITYDEIGNPLQYRDGISFTWAKGRQLQGITKDGLNASYTYDENGLRISKTVNGITTKIFRTNGQPVGMNISDGKDVTFILDGDGKVYGVHYDHYSASGLRSETYYFAYNAQGDVIGIYDFSGRLMATYDYDEWGNCTVNVLAADNNGHAIDSLDHIAHVNPFRYRGYFYDAETGFYYLNSRYYDPGTGRFVNADDESISQVSPESTNYDKNLFAYCDNNPISREDSDGDFWVTVGIMAVGGVIGSAVSAISSAATQKILTGTVNWKSVGVAAATGFVSGAIAASPLGMVGQKIAGGIIGGLSYATDCYVNNRSMTLIGTVASVGGGVISAKIGGGGANEHGALSTVVRNTKQTIIRESRRANRQYASKATAMAISSCSNTLANSAWSSSARFAAGCGVSNGINAIGGWIQNLIARWKR